MSANLAVGARPAVVGPLFIATLGMLMAFGPMGVDIYLPALPTIAQAFGIGQDSVQWSLSAFFLGFGIGQIVWGALGDWLGRRGPIAAGILLYAAGCIGCSLSDGIVTLSFWRFAQAFGACAGPVLARAMLRDIYQRDRAASMLSMMMLVMGIAPMIAPLIGGQILLLSGWRTIFWAQAVFGAAALAGLMALPETLPPERRNKTDLMGMLTGYGRLLADRRCLGYAFCSAFIYAGLFAYVSGTPFVYIELFGVRPENYGYLFAINIVSMILVNTMNSRLVLRYGTDRMLRIGSFTAAFFGLVLLAIALTGFAGLAGIAGGLFLFMGMTGMVGANASAGAMSTHPELAGSASAMVGMLQFALGGVAGAAVGFFADGTAVPMAAVIAGVAVVGLGFNLLLVRRSKTAAA
jgi:DHA1 family bicyclomycin/chloramphenicol resistance-like MFS transporter